MLTGQNPYSVVDPKYKEFQSYVDKRKTQYGSIDEGKYKPSPVVNNVKGVLAVASLHPTAALIAGPISSGGNLYTAGRYAMDGQWGNALQDLGQAAIDFVPGVNSGYRKLQRSLQAARFAKNVGLVGNDVLNMQRSDGSDLIQARVPKSIKKR